MKARLLSIFYILIITTAMMRITYIGVSYKKDANNLFKVTNILRANHDKDVDNKKTYNYDIPNDSHWWIRSLLEKKLNYEEMHIYPDYLPLEIIAWISLIFTLGVFSSYMNNHNKGTGL